MLVDQSIFQSCASVTFHLCSVPHPYPLSQGDINEGTDSAELPNSRSGWLTLLSAKLSMERVKFQRRRAPRLGRALLLNVADGTR